MRTWRGRLDQLTRPSLGVDVGDAPGTIVVGRVVELRTLIAGVHADDPGVVAMALSGGLS